ncbi:MAG: GMC family oxidoreductase [Candidatus Omnitrophota bacterium]
MNIKADIVVIGSGAGGASVARELAKQGRDVLLLEKGKLVKKVGNMIEAAKYYDFFTLRRSIEGFYVYSAIMGGGTTNVSCGNGIPVLAEELKDLGIDLTEEFQETEKEMGVEPISNELIGKGSKLIMDIGNKMGLEMRPMPKCVNARKCTSCGLCVLGCKRGAKWTTMDYVKQMHDFGGRIFYSTDVRRIAIKGNKAVGIIAVRGRKIVRIHANVVVLAAGALASPRILLNSGIENAGKSLFVDFLNVACGILEDKRINPAKEITMSVVSTKYLKDKGFLLSPFMFPPLTMATMTPKLKLHKLLQYGRILGVMTKMKDDNEGEVLADGRFHKRPTDKDKKILNEGAEISKEILRRAGVKERNIFILMPSGAHPGGSNPIGKVVDTNLKTKIDNLFVCDASVLPVSSGAPPIVTIISLGKRLARII